MEPTTAKDLEPSAKEGPNGPVENKEVGKPEVAAAASPGEPGDLPMKNYNTTYRHRAKPTPDEVIAEYNAAVDLIAPATKKFSDAGMQGTEAGKLALELFTRLFVNE